MSERFFSPQPITSDQVTLDGPEAHHLLHVMRASPGDPATLFDDSGDEFDAVVAKLERRAVVLRILDRRAADRELPFPLALGVALPKGDRQKWLVEKLTELGAAALVPLTTERGVAQPTAGALDRLRRTAIEAAKQCGRNRLLQIAPPQFWDNWLRDTTTAWRLGSSAGEPPAARRLFAHPGGTPLSQLELNSPHPTRIAIGPEGGFTDGEVAAAIAAGWLPIDLGPRILRVETAAVALAAAVALR